MAVSPLEIVSLERMRNELRIPEGDTDHDEFIKELIGSAVPYVAADLSVPLIDVEVYIDVLPTPNLPVVIKDVFAKS